MIEVVFAPQSSFTAWPVIVLMLSKLWPNHARYSFIPVWLPSKVEKLMSWPAVLARNPR